jgi:hypothetical protein
MSDFWRWVALLALPGLLAAGLLGIMWQNLRTRGWRSTIGQIRESRSATRDVRSKDVRFSPRTGDTGRSTTTTTDRIERKTFAAIAYEYTVDGKRFFGRRVGIGEDTGNEDVPALLRRYPVGKAVTVWFNPAAPGEAILERDSMRRIGEAWFGIAVLTAVILGGYYGFEHVLAWVQAHARNPRRVPFAMIVGGGGVLLALIALAAWRNLRTMRRWPTAAGTVVESHVEHATTKMRRGRRVTLTPFYIPRVIYKYAVDGVDLQGDQHGRMTSSTDQAAVEAAIARFPVGTPVTVHYDPAQPTTAVVNPTGGRIGLYLALGSIALLAIAGGVLTL